MKKLLLLLWLASPLMAEDQYGPDLFVLYGWGEGGDGLGYGIRNSRVDEHGRETPLSAPKSPIAGTPGRYDNSVPGYRSHGLFLSHPYYGKLPREQHVYYANDKRERGRHSARLEYTRHGPAYIPDDH